MNLLSVTAAWLHDLSPFVIRLWGEFGVRWYGLAYAAGFVIAFFVLRWMGRRGLTPIPPHRAGDAILILVGGVMIGGRLGYVLVYDPSLLTSLSSSPPWWGVLMVNKGGMASHGGMVGVAVACWIIARGFRVGNGEREGGCPFLHVLDLTALLAPPGLFLGRLANFINGELLGRIVSMPGEPAPWWAVRFPQEFLGDHDCSNLLPAEEASERTRAIVSIVRGAGYDGDFEAGYRRVLEKIQAGHADLARQLEPWISARHPSQIYQALAEGVVAGAVAWWFWRRPRVPGTTACVFLIAYGALRIVTELYRLPDAHLHVQRVAGMSRGQWLSAGMVAIGAVLLATLFRRATPTMGGWSAGRTVGT